MPRIASAKTIYHVLKIYATLNAGETTPFKISRHVNSVASMPSIDKNHILCAETIPIIPDITTPAQTHDNTIHRINLYCE